MKSSLFFVLGLIIVLYGGCQSTPSIPLFDGTLEYAIGPEWKLQPDTMSMDKQKVFVFKRDGIKDKSGQRIIPAIVGAANSMHREFDPVHFAPYARARFGLTNEAEVYSWHDNMFSIKSGILFKGKKFDDFTKMHHTILLLSATYGSNVMTIIANVPTELFPKVEPEFLAFFRSLKLVTDRTVPFLHERRVGDMIGIAVDYGPVGMIKKRAKQNVQKTN